MNKKYNLYLKGFVGGYDFDSSYVEYILSKHPDEEVTVLIDSLGGSLATALTIASCFSRHGNVSVHFAGMNASAATIAALGARKVTMETSAMYLVHKCSSSVFEWGSLNADELATLIGDLEAQKRDLEKMDLNVAQMYARRTSKPKDELLALMKVGGWMSAKEAKEWGFVDEVTDDAQPAPVMTDEVATALASAGIPVPDIPVGKKESAFARFLAAFSQFLSRDKGAGAAEKVDDNPAVPEGKETPPAKDTASEDTVADTPAADTPPAEQDPAEQGAAETTDDTPAVPVSEPDNSSLSPATHSNPTDMNKIYTTVMALLAVEAFTANADGSITLTAEQMQAIDTQLQQQQADLENKIAEAAAKDTELAAVKEELETLRKAPGDSTAHVIHASVDGAGSQQEYLDAVAEAQKLYDMLP